MIDLDQPAAYVQVDPADMLSRVRDMASQTVDAWRIGSSIDAPAAYQAADAIIVLGMGGSAIGGDLVRVLAGPVCGVPIIVSREYDLPAWVNENTLVIASSYSGNTEETLSATRQAIDVGAHVVAVTTGGALERVARQHGFPLVTYHYPAQPRAALGYSMFCLLGVLSKLGFLHESDLARGDAVTAIKERLGECDVTVPTAENPAKRLAHELSGKLVVVYGGGILSELARRWKGQFNENAKNWAFFEQFPELNHNAVIGYAYPRELVERLVVLILSSNLNHPRVTLREEVTADLLARNRIPYQLLRAHGHGALAHLCSLGVLVDFVSYYLALLNGVDPSEIENIDYLKGEMSKVL